MKRLIPSWLGRRRPAQTPNPAPRPPKWVRTVQTDDRYLWTLDRADVDKVIHYTHWIPMSRGFTQAFLAEHYPGWTLGGMMSLFDAAGIRITPAENEGSPGAPHGGRCHWQVVSFHFSTRDDFVVVWDRTIEKDERYLAHDATGPTGRGPTGGAKVEPVEAPRPVDLEGKVFFD